jgi:hypothetical protein
MRLQLFLMGIFSFFSSLLAQDHPKEQAPVAAIVVDLKEFKIGSTPLGSLVAPTDPFHAALRKADEFKPPGQGLDVGTKDGVLDYGFFDLDAFNGSFTRSGEPVKLGNATTEAEVLSAFGEPYWIDRSDGEVILFYVYEAGTIELQFEFPDGKTLGCITLARNGVLSEADQREAYGVTKPWPPP